MTIELLVNGEARVLEVEASDLLLDVLRDRLGLTGAKRSCEVQVCGTCTVLLDGAPVSACCTLAADADGRSVETIEGFARDERFAAFEAAFTRHAALQCGFCTPGMVLTAKWLLDGDEVSSVEDVRRALAGNLCRCTGYKGILEAVCELAGIRA